MKRCQRIHAIVTAGATAALIVIMVVPAAAQERLASASPSAAAARSTGAVGAEASEHVDLLVGRSTVLRTDRPIKRVSLPKPDVADAMVTSPNEVLVHGKAPGTISLLIWGDTGQIRSYDISVRRDLSSLEERVRQLFPGEPITVSSNGVDVVLSGSVSSKYVVDKATSLALGYVDKPDNVINLLRQAEGVASNQVLLRVRFAEVSRTALQELGASFFTGAGGYKDWIGRTSTQQFPAPDFDAEKGLVFSDFLNLLAFNTKEQLGVVVRALQTKGLFQSLAEPNLVTQNGQEASFLAGGEYPYPVLQGSGLNAAVTIMFKEFGVRLRFTPTIIGSDLVHLKVAPEVSALDFGNAVTIEGFRVPALSTRRTETQVELRDGQTFAIAGLIDNSVTQTMSKIPGLGDIPILGLLFKSRAYQKNATELVVMITPQILRKDSTGVTPNLPGLVQPFLRPEKKLLPPPPPAFSTPQATRPQDAAALKAAPAPKAAPASVAIVTTPTSPMVGAASGTGAPTSAVTVPAPAAATPMPAPAAPLPSTTAPMPAAVAPAPMVVAPAPADAPAGTTVIEQPPYAPVVIHTPTRPVPPLDVNKESDDKAARDAWKAEAKRLAQEREQGKRAEREAVKRAREQGEIDRKRMEAEKKEAEQAKKAEAKLAKERAKQQADEAKRAAEIEKARREADRKKEEERREDAQERARRDPYPPLRSRVTW